MADYYSVTEYAKMTGRDAATIRRLLAYGRLAGIKIGKQWAIPKGEHYPEDRRLRSGEYRYWRDENAKRQVSLEEIREKRRTSSLTDEEIVERTGLSLDTIKKIFSGETEHPRKETLRKLGEVFETQSFHYDRQTQDLLMVAETPLEYGIRRRKTIRDYMNLPEERRVELIDGEFYEMSAPRGDHQIVSAFLHRQLLNYVLENNGNCMPLAAPCDVQLEKDQYTMLQPDLLVLCDRSMFRNGLVYGAPDLVMEILSPSTREKDFTLKYAKYAGAGVKEYWIIDIEKEVVVVYHFNEDYIPTIYSFKDQIPVGIWDGQCLIDMAEIREQLKLWNQI